MAMVTVVVVRVVVVEGPALGGDDLPGDYDALLRARPVDDVHVDAPGHFVTDGRRAPELRPHELFAPAAVIDIATIERTSAGCPRTVSAEAQRISSG